MPFFGRTQGHARLRLTSSDGPDDHLRFDMVLIVGSIRPETDVRMQTDESTPAELHLPDGDLVAIFRQLPGGSGTLVVEYTNERGGKKRAYARVMRRLAVITRRGGRVISGGLNGSEEGQAIS